ncbi:glycoside hydrolase family 3 N-terminal domain-containing protein [uncultured Mucilaginibacter sp.]|uniref:glycoside hydrolase family 3 N-terminal domain-containing protein n=1 Tax=uncultured Mucilaginibacter sp. TaxID=797541 RepID=UPI0025E80197|nr:glycoside hydrolase family 3 N-terminal domain-containing protein [uncultured Mucilaginibacter sp.]
MARIKPLILFGLIGILSSFNIASAQKLTVQQKVDALVKKMTLAEKIGQLNQYNGDWDATGPVTKDVGNKLDAIKRGEVGSILNITGVKHTRVFQEAAMQSRLKIPLLFGQDVIHGYSITFPIPLAEAASWDIPAIERSARIAGTEAAAGGVHWTFAPMVDIARDPRWGRVMEGAGEDPYLGSLIAGARVRGFQGKGLGNLDAVMACAKHFTAYGAAIGGRDYNSVDMSLRTLWEIYLPPFKAAVDAGAATFMNSFNDLNGTPASANSYLMRDILKGKWGFKGFVVSDWGSIGEMINHGYVKDNYEAARASINAGSDMDMESRSYINNLAKLVADKKVSVAVIDDAVKRILTKKFEMGLFDDPYRFSNADRENSVLNAPAHIAAARDMADKSIVLLKNENNLLPLSNNLKSIALIGPLVKSKAEMKGFWAQNIGDESKIVSLYEGMQQAAPNTSLLYAKGCDITDTSKAGFDEAYKTAMQAEVVVMAMGERPDMTGEAKSRSNIHLPGVQEELIQKIMATGKPVVVLLMSGRPMVFNWTADHVPAILYTWWLGNQAGTAMADILFGKYNPGAKLPITFPRTEGQIPIYYNHLNTGRPAHGDNDVNYTSAYIDLPNSPKFAFGHGLSYTTFNYSNLKLSKKSMQKDGAITVTFDLQNTGKYAGEEVAQFYLRDLVSQPVRPIKELKGFEKVSLQPGETKTITLTINKQKLSFYNDQLQWITQPGDFRLMIGSASDDIRLEDGFTLL